ncbi:GIY-YIG nuclease family protein [Streptomyces sp. PA03-1a]|nr:GIY-YIG nuclease family protein [Streptomyces sp. PA03-1a]MDX2813381.1 GIY-YIG nuclease family protein [Streptomyces sp. PA03-5A]
MHAAEDGVSCFEAATCQTPVPLCTPHRMQVAIAIVPDILSVAAETADVTPTNAVDPHSARLLRAARKAPLLLNTAHEPQVYFIEHGRRVKIGYTTNLGKRISSLSLRPSAVVLALWGDRQLEQALHLYFDPFRVEDSEWFRREAPVRSYMDGKRRHEDLEPVALAAELAEGFTSRRCCLWSGTWASTAGKS